MTGSSATSTVSDTKGEGATGGADDSAPDADVNLPEILVPRRRPAQQRSRERYARILAAARSVLVDVGFESFTFDEVARRAEVPIGTLYQFFANKYVMICELDRADSAAVVREIHRFANFIPALEWPEFLSEFIDHIADLWSNDVSRRAVWLAVQSTPATRATAADTERELLDAISEILRPLTPGQSPEIRHFIAGLLVHTTFSLLNYSVQNPGPESISPTDVGPFALSHYDLTVQEVKRMLVSYLLTVAGSLGSGVEDMNPDNPGPGRHAKDS